MIHNALHDKELPVYGDGLQVRDWLYVYDHCTAIWRVLEQGTPGEIYNIGGCNEKANIEVVKLILGRVGKPATLIRHVKDRPGHDRRYAIDASKIMRRVGLETLRHLRGGHRPDHRLVSEQRPMARERRLRRVSAVLRDDVRQSLTRHGRVVRLRLLRRCAPLRN